MIKSYFNTLNKYKETYGKKTILLWQCGHFFEVYGYKNPKTNEYYGSQISNFSQICDLAIANKKKCVNNEHIVMSGFSPITRLDKYLPRLNNKGYTVAVWIQDEKIVSNRYEFGIFSPGTYFNINENSITNNIMCIWIEKYGKTLLNKQPSITCGMSVINNITGKSFMFEFSEKYFHNPTTFNEIERFYSIHSPNEVIIIHSGYENINDVIQFSSIDCQTIHIISLDDEKDPRNKQAKNCEKQIYQQKLLETFYSTNEFESFFESLQFREYPIATQSFCYLLNFVHTHDSSLVKKIAEPIFDNVNNTLLLANHSLKQLNILGDNKFKGKLSSVVNFINKCKTIMGKREFMQQLLTPTTDINYLNKEYNIIDYIKNNYNKYENIRKQLSSMKDIEKFYRKIILNKLAPCELVHFYNDMENILKIHKFIVKDKCLHKYININIKPICQTIMTFLSTKINFDQAIHSQKINIEENIFNHGQYCDLDILATNNQQNYSNLYTMQKYLSSFLNEKRCKDPIKIHETEKSGLCLIATKRRVNLIKEKLSKKNIVFESLTITPTFKFSTSIAGNLRISNDELNLIYANIGKSKFLLINKLRETYKQFLSELQIFHTEIETFIKYITILDIILTKAYISKKFNYCKPIIDNEKESSFFNAKKMRHVLIEQIQKNEIYVPNDISLNKEGILLYGTNAVGKSCLIRSIGITIILAQSGMFVPCESFIYKPYTSIFTRILGNDNIFKGLSTFAVEMSELRTILCLADQNSLILGDELCSGTETNSAISIFIAGLMFLYKKKCSFIFATHLHEITKMEEIKKMERISIKHMAVKYNREINELIYDRRLKDGPGDSMYGLEVCKSLNLPKDFLEKAYEIRNNNNILNNDISYYNSKLIKDKCELCNDKGIDIHHLKYQEFANDNDYIGTFHKNHIGNLINICKKCHKTIHKLKIQYVKKKTTNGIKIFKE